MFENIYGLSCVENHVLAILRDEGNNIAPLYHNCALSLRQLFYFMVTKQQSPYYFNIIPRVQDELSQMGVLGLKFRQSKASHNICSELSKLVDNEKCLIRVSPTFTKICFRSRIKRDDHFVRAEAVQGEFVIYNDIPEKVMTISGENLKKAFEKQYIVLKVKKVIDEPIIDSLWQSRIFKAEEYIPYRFCESDLEAVEDLSAKIRNMLQIYKTLIYRMAEYYGLYVDTEFIKIRIPEVEHYFALSEYYCLKQNTTNNQLLKLLSDLSCLEQEIMFKLNSLLGEMIA